MALGTKLQEFHHYMRANHWYVIFTWFTRIVLAAGFIPSGWVKITGERFTSLSSEHPMGAYLDALFDTGYYYTFLGLMQLLAALLLLIPRTTLLGVLIYFPIILNIFILSFAVRFDGSLFTAPLMVLGCLYLFYWDYPRLAPILLPGSSKKTSKAHSWKFPYITAPLVLLILVASPFLVYNLYEIMPKNTLEICEKQCRRSEHPENCQNFCACIHLEGNPLRKCLEAYESKVPNGG